MNQKIYDRILQNFSKFFINLIKYFLQFFITLSTFSFSLLLVHVEHVRRKRILVIDNKIRSGCLLIPSSWRSGASTSWRSIISARASAATASSTATSESFGWTSSATSASSIQFPAQFTWDWLQMHEVTEGSFLTSTKFVLTATSFTKIGDWGKFGIYGFSVEPTIVQILHTTFRILFLVELDVDVANHVFSNVITDVHLFNFAIFVIDFIKNFLKKIVKELLLLIVLLTNLKNIVINNKQRIRTRILI